jgi:hypothetical protein
MTNKRKKGPEELKGEKERRGKEIFSFSGPLRPLMGNQRL